MEETKQALVLVDVRNPRLVETWDDLGSGVQIPGPLNPGWGYSKRWGDSRDWDDEDAAWEGSMSESKAEYYARHLEQTQQDHTTATAGHRHAWDVVADELSARARGLIDDAGITWDTPVGIPSEPRPAETVQPTGLPTLLAGMVTEYHGALKLNGYSGFPDRLVEGFSQMLLACAQPAITAYLEQLTTPPKFVVREQ